MKKFKFMAFLLFTVILSVNLTSCSDDDEPGNPSSMTEKLQGEWFLVRWDADYYDEDPYYCEWDYDNQTAYGHCPEEGSLRPEKLIISHTEEDGFSFENKSYASYYFGWVTEETFSVPTEEVLSGSFQVSDDYEESVTWKIKVSLNDMVITETVIYSQGEKDVHKYTYRRNNLFIDDNEICTDKEVDLGLSVKWAGWNFGATSPAELGGRYAWGEFEEKDEYTENNYKHSLYDTFGDEISGTPYDVVHHKWGDNWRMPTVEEARELVNICTWTKVTYKGVEGYKVKSPNGKSIFLPDVEYWTGSIYDRASNGKFYYVYSFQDGYVNNVYRYNGLYIRPVKSKE